MNGLGVCRLTLLLFFLDSNGFELGSALWSDGVSHPGCLGFHLLLGRWLMTFQVLVLSSWRRTSTISLIRFFGMNMRYWLILEADREQLCSNDHSLLACLSLFHLKMHCFRSNGILRCTTITTLTTSYHSRHDTHHTTQDWELSLLRATEEAEKSTSLVLLLLILHSLFHRRRGHHNKERILDFDGDGGSPGWLGPCFHQWVVARSPEGRGLKSGRRTTSMKTNKIYKTALKPRPSQALCRPDGARKTAKPWSCFVRCSFLRINVCVDLEGSLGSLVQSRHPHTFIAHIS